MSMLSAGDGGDGVEGGGVGDGVDGGEAVDVGVGVVDWVGVTAGKSIPATTIRVTARTARRIDLRIRQDLSYASLSLANRLCDRTGRQGGDMAGSLFQGAWQHIDWNRRTDPSSRWYPRK